MTDLEREACRVLASIALIEANGNSEPDIMADALENAVADAQAFFRMNRLRLADFVGAVREG